MAPRKDVLLTTLIAWDQPLPLLVITIPTIRRDDRFVCSILGKPDKESAQEGECNG